jgi:hypothetical protein
VSMSRWTWAGTAAARANTSDVPAAVVDVYAKVRGWSIALNILLSPGAFRVASSFQVPPQLFLAEGFLRYLRAP